VAERGTLLEALGTQAPQAGPLPPDIAAAIHAYVSAAPSLMLLLQAEDLAGARIGVNLPGTDYQRPNWRYRMTPDAHAVFETPVAHAILATLAERRNLTP